MIERFGVFLVLVEEEIYLMLVIGSLIADCCRRTYGGSDYSEVTANCAIHIEVRGTWLPCWRPTKLGWSYTENVLRGCQYGVMDVLTMLKKR